MMYLVFNEVALKVGLMFDGCVHMILLFLTCNRCEFDECDAYDVFILWAPDMAVSKPVPSTGLSTASCTCSAQRLPLFWTRLPGTGQLT